MESETILSRIKSPKDVKALLPSELPLLASEVRDRIIEVTHKNGGHLASNLGVVELTIALHRVFNSPEDQFVWDVGHQCYTHKILTGRNDLFDTIRLKNGLSGFPKRSESIHDPMDTGHASTSISAALGILIGKRQQNNYGKVIAVIGDGALTGGMSFEALNHAGQLKNDLIVIFNDNKMSISKNVGGFSSHSNIAKGTSFISRLTATRSYQRIRDMIDTGLLKIPLFGYKIFQTVMRLKKGVKAVLFHETLFSELGFEYVGPLDGHSINMLIRVLENVKELHKPVVVHVVTKKGKGFKLAEDNPVRYHGIGPMTAVDGRIEPGTGTTFTEAFAESLVRLAQKDKRIVAVTAAMVKGTGLSLFQKKYPERIFDTGIAEQHAVTFSAGLAVSGLKPVTAIYSTFMQRAVDQVIHDVALPGLPVVIAMDRSGLVPGDGETHQGIFDISIFGDIPGLEIVAPCSQDEMAAMLAYGINSSGPVMIRYPKAQCPASFHGTGKPLERGRGVFLTERKGCLLLAVSGSLVEEALGAVEILAADDIVVDLYNLRFIKPLDEEYFYEILSSYDEVFFLEENTENGSIGGHAASLAHHRDLMTIIHSFFVPDEFISQGTRSELLQYCGFDRAGIAQSVLSSLAVKSSLPNSMAL